MAPTKKTSQTTSQSRAAKAKTGQNVGAPGKPERARSVDDERVEPTTSTEPAPTEPRTKGTQEAMAPAEPEQPIDDGRPDVVSVPPQRPVAETPLSATQLQNDPLLGTHDEIIVDLGIKLRWAAVAYALLGVAASWLIAAQVGLAVKGAAPYAWALAATILIAAGAIWYVVDVATRFTSVAAYRKAKTPQAIARLQRGGVVGLYSAIGTWIGVGIGVLVVISGTVTAVLTIAFGASGWAWFFGALPVVLLYLYSFGLLHYRLLEKARDAVA